MRTLNFQHVGRQMSESFLTAAVLSISGGLQDVYTYVSRGEVFANAQTGNIVLFSQHVTGNLRFVTWFRFCFLHLEWQLRRGFVSLFKMPRDFIGDRLFYWLKLFCCFWLDLCRKNKIWLPMHWCPFPVQCRFNPLEKLPAMHLPVQCVLAIWEVEWRHYVLIGRIIIDRCFINHSIILESFFCLH